MRRKICKVLGCLMFLWALSPQALYASQVYGHLYFSGFMLQTRAGQHLSLHDRNRNSFLLGSFAPDSAWIAHMVTNPTIRERLREKYAVKFPKSLRPLPAQCDDVHQVKPTAVSLQLIATAKTEEDRAFALGWLSHYTVDSHIHDLINKQGGFVIDPTQFEAAAMKLHDRLEALEMRHVLHLRGQSLRDSATDARSAGIPGPFLRAALAGAYPQNNFYVNHPEYFIRYFHFSSGLVIDSARWYGYQSQHSPAEISRKKKLIRRFRPSTGRIIDVLTDLPSIREYRNNPENERFIADWTLRAEDIRQSSVYLMDNCTAYYWWKDRQTPAGSEMAATTLLRIEAEMRRINPADDLMLPRQIR